MIIVVYFVYAIIITKHLMTAPLGNICFVSLKSRCFDSNACFHLLNQGHANEFNQCYPTGQHLEILLTSRWILLLHCCVWERENSAGKLVAARTKSSFLQFWLLFSFKNKNGAPKETFCSSYRRWNWRTPCRKRLHKHSKLHKDCL